MELVTILVSPLGKDYTIPEWMLNLGNIVIPMDKIKTRLVQGCHIPSRTYKCIVVLTQSLGLGGK